MTLKDNLSNLESQKKLDKIPIDKKNVDNIFIKATKAYRFSSIAVDSAFKNIYDYDNDIFTHTYNALKFGFTSLLYLYGYKTKSTGGGNYLAFAFGKDILIEEFNKISKDEEEVDKIKNITKRIEKIVQERNDDLYTPINVVISRTDLIALITDTKFLLDKIQIVIQNN